MERLFRIFDWLQTYLKIKNKLKTREKEEKIQCKDNKDFRMFLIKRGMNLNGL